MKENCTIILLPVYNDWESALLLIKDIIRIQNEFSLEIQIIVVNDGSTIEYQQEFENLPIYWQIIHLNRNVGHQKAIALGLSYIADKKIDEEGWDNIIVMDSDGEDQANDIVQLIKKVTDNPNKVIFAHRQKRSEGVIFKTGYFFYKILFSALTGKKISFGNFSLIPQRLIKKIVLIPELSSHYSGAILKSKIPYTIIPTNRGKRLAGQSKMNLPNLVLHGLSAVAVHSEMVALRLLFTSFALIFLAILIIGVVTYIKLFTSQATPGWATTIISGSLVIITQIFFTSLSLLFLILTYRSQNLSNPFTIYKDFIDKVEISKYHTNEKKSI